MRTLSLNQNPFTPARIQNLLKPDPNGTHLTARENSQLEFKETFSFKAFPEYSRSMAGFANNRGGYLVFGITDAPRKIVGLSSKRFEDMDTRQITEFLNEYFEPELCWTPHIHSFGTLKIGLIYTYQSESRPVVCKKNKSPLKEAAIYYRYRGTTRVIRFSELKTLLEEQRRLERDWWLKTLSRIASVGVENVGVLNTADGTVEGPGANFLIDSSLLDKINFIKSGHFSESEGQPTLRVIGEAEIVDQRVVQPLQTVSTTRALRFDDLVSGFLDRVQVERPEEHITQICYESSGYLPVFYYAQIAGLDIDGIKALVSSCEGAGPSRNRLLKRLDSKGRVQNLSQRLKDLREGLVSGVMPSWDDETSVRHHLDAVCTFLKEDINSEVEPFLNGFLKECLQRYHGFENQNTKQSFRYAICHLDRQLFQP